MNPEKENPALREPDFQSLFANIFSERMIH